MPNTDAEIPYSPDCSKPEGWHYLNVAGDIKDLPLTDCATVALCPQSCDDLKVWSTRRHQFRLRMPIDSEVEKTVVFIAVLLLQFNVVQKDLRSFLFYRRLTILG
jgi:hypothetical protein